VPGQTIELQPPPPEPIVSRPLKTGQQFTLVLHKHRYVYRGWDKEDYQPGDDAELHVEGEALGKELEFVIERAEEGGSAFAEVARVKAQIESDGKKAKAKFKFPKPDPKGHVTKVEWKRARAKAGERLGMHVEAENYEGGFLKFTVERQDEHGQWIDVARWDGSIESGKADTVYQIPAPPKGKPEPKRGDLVDAAFQDRKPKAGETSWLLANTKGLDGAALQFVLEGIDENGNWRELASAVATVKDGKAAPAVAIPAGAAPRNPPPVPEGFVPVRFSHPLYAKGEELVVHVDPRWPKGGKFEVVLEGKSTDDEKWRQLAVVEAVPEAGK